MNKKTIIWVVVAIIIVVAISLGMRGTDTKAPAGAVGKIVKIGVVAPLTGGASGYGLPLIKGVELASKALAGTKNTYEVVFEDDGTNPANAASAAQKLVNVDKVDAIITTTSGTGNAVKPIATAAGIPHICVCTDSRLVDNKTNFTYLVVPEIEARAWADEVKTYSPKKIALIWQNHPGFVVLIEPLKTYLAEAGISVVFEEKYDPAVKDFKTVLAKAVAAKPDFYYIGGFPPSIDVLGKELKNLGIKNYGGTGTYAISPDPSTFNDAWFSDIALGDVGFKVQFEAAYPDVRFNVRTAPEGYDVFTMLVKAFESGSVPAEYISSLTSYEGKVGKATKAVDSGVFNLPVGIWKIENGKAVQVK